MSSPLNTSESKTGWSQAVMIGIMALLTLWVVVSTVVGVVRVFSPVPMIDMWGGYVDFFERVKAGDVGAWWRPHNEHRMVWSRLLFWIDLEYFRGTTVLQYVASFLMVVLSVAVFHLFAKRIDPQPARAKGLWVLTLLLTAMLFYWGQFENFTWAFQNCFFMAQTFPLMALYGLAQWVSNQGDTSKRWWIAATLMGVASMGTLASGIFVLPIMIAYSLLNGQSRGRWVTLVVITGACWVLFFANYRGPGHQGAGLAALLHHPVQSLGFVLLFLGGPLFHLTGQGKIGGAFAGLAGLVFVALTLHLTWQCWHQKADRSYKGALLAFVLFIGLCAVATASGRVNLGIAQALVSRYSTPALMGWAALLVAYSDRLIPLFQQGSKKALLPLMLVLLAMLPFQHKALTNLDDVVADRLVAALALELQIDDDNQIKEVFPDSAYALRVSQSAIAANHSIFGLAPIRDAALVMGQVQALGRTTCAVDELQQVHLPARPEWVRVTGRVRLQADPNLLQSQAVSGVGEARLLDGDGHVVGLVLMYQHPGHGQMQPPSPGVIEVDMKGYLSQSSIGKSLSLHAAGQHCTVQLAPAT